MKKVQGMACWGSLRCSYSVPSTQRPGEALRYSGTCTPAPLGLSDLRYCNRDGSVDWRTISVMPSWPQVVAAICVSSRRRRWTAFSSHRGRQSATVLHRHQLPQTSVIYAGGLASRLLHSTERTSVTATR